MRRCGLDDLNGLPTVLKSFAQVSVVTLHKRKRGQDLPGKSRTGGEGLADIQSPLRVLLRPPRSSCCT